MPCPVWLDSGVCGPKNMRRYDWMSAQADATLNVLAGEGNIWERLSAFAQERRCGLPLVEYKAEEQALWPFCSGVVATIAYDAVTSSPSAARIAAGAATPILWAASYSWALVQDHWQRQAFLVCAPETPAAERRRLLALVSKKVAHRPCEPFKLESPFVADSEQDVYRFQFDKIQNYLLAGDCYQVNLARRFRARCRGSSWDAYRQLRAKHAAPFSAYCECPDYSLLCFSPELFLSLSGNQVLTQPIKGSIARGQGDEDAKRAASLLHSEKDRAENLMIVDLLRNDLSRVCELGSVELMHLCQLDSYSAVHHLSSKIGARLRAECSAIELLQSCFPGGSITGAPKQRSMEIIAELEPARRALYCGSLCFLGKDGSLQSNILIRIMLRTNSQIYAWSGGAIVADSDCAAEFAETQSKMGALMKQLGPINTAIS